MFRWFVAIFALLVPGRAVAEDVFFGRHVQAVFSRLGCNGGQCHGAVQGKNGFRLSLFGADPILDHDRLLHADGGRRLNFLDPDQSLLLLKATGRVAHGGGVRTTSTSVEYRILRQWIAAGAPGETAEQGRVIILKASPAEKSLRPGESFSLKIEATYVDGTTEDVTSLCSFESLDAKIAAVDGQGEVRAGSVGDTALIVRFRADPVLARVLVPRVADEPFPHVQGHNFIDGHVLQRLRRMNVPPSPLADDATFLRRVCLDLTGELPGADEVRTYLADSRADKRARKIDELLTRPGHAALWTLNVCDILKANEWGEFGSPLSYEKEATRFQAWVRARFDENMPYDQLVERVLTATSREGKALKDHAQDGLAMLEGFGPGRKDLELYSKRRSPDLYWQRHNSTGVAATLQVAHAFLGLRLECAKCHRHPSDIWQQDDLLSFANFFMGVRSIAQSNEVSKLYPDLDAARKELEAEAKELNKKIKAMKDEPGKKLEDEAKKSRAELEKLSRELQKAEGEATSFENQAKQKPAEAVKVRDMLAAARQRVAELRTTLAPHKEAVSRHDAFVKEVSKLSKRAEIMGNLAMRILQMDIHIVANPKPATVTSPIGTQTSKVFRLLGEAAPVEVPAGRDPRAVVMDWLRRPDNPYFARALVNRVWAHYFGRGIVDPPDNLSPFNPATHPELLKELSDGFIKSGFDLRWLHRTIVSSRTYQQSSRPTKANEMDRANYAYFAYRRLPAEVLIDMLGQATGTAEKMGVEQQQHLPETMKAVSLPYVPPNGFVAFMLENFGRSKRNGVVQCDCQRDPTTTMLQVMSLANHPRVWERINDASGLAATVAKKLTDPDRQIEELFLTILSRFPSESERRSCRSYLTESTGLVQGLQGIVWGLINTKEFMLQH